MPGDLVVGAAERPQDEQVVVGLGQDDPLAAAGPDEGPDGEASRCSRACLALPKTLGYFATIAAQSPRRCRSAMTR